MSQISRPMRIALGAVLVFAVAWMTVLKPKTPDQIDPAAVASAAAVAPVTPAAAPSAPEAAQGAVDVSAQAAQAHEAAAGNPSTAAPGAGAGEAVEAASEPSSPGDRSPAGPTTVLLFAGAGADDRVAREVVRSVQRPGVRTIVAGLGDVRKYRDLVGSVEILVAPTILVVGPDRTARRIDGLPDAAQVEQALTAARGR